MLTSDSNAYDQIRLFCNELKSMPNNSDLRTKIRKLISEDNTILDFHVKEVSKNLSELEKVPKNFLEEDLLKVDSAYHIDQHSSSRKLLTILADASNTFTYQGCQIEKSLLCKNQIRKDGVVLNGKTEPIYVDCYHYDAEDKKLILAGIDFDDNGYFNAELLCKNLLNAMANYIDQNSDHKACLVITGRLEKEFIKWLLTPAELSKDFATNINKIEILYAITTERAMEGLEPEVSVSKLAQLGGIFADKSFVEASAERAELTGVDAVQSRPPVADGQSSTALEDERVIGKSRFVSREPALNRQQDTFFYPIRSISKIAGIRPPYSDPDIENSWKYINFETLLLETAEKSGIDNNFKNLLWENFNDHVRCIRTKPKHQIDTNNSIENLMATASDKFTDYLKRLLLAKEDSREESELASILVNLKLAQSKNAAKQRIKEASHSSTIEDCKKEFEKNEALLKANIGEVKSSSTDSKAIFLDWEHLLQDTFAKNINYAEEEQTYCFPVNALKDKLDIYSEESPYFNIEQYYIAYVNEYKPPIYVWKTVQSESFDSKKSSKKLASSRMTFWHLYLESAIHDLFCLTSRVKLEDMQVESLAKKLANLIFEHINIKEHADIYRLVETVKTNYNFSSDDVALNTVLNIVFDKNAVNKLLNKFSQELSTLKRAPNKREYAETLDAQYTICYNQLISTHFDEFGFTLGDLYKLCSKYPDTNIQVSETAIDNIVQLLKSLTHVVDNNLSIHKIANTSLNKLIMRQICRQPHTLCKFIYVIVDGQITLAPECFYRPEGQFEREGKSYSYIRPAHSQLAKGKAVQAAGECIFMKPESGKWRLSFLTNGSGHYRPDAFSTLPVARQTFIEALGNATYVDLQYLVLRNTITPNTGFDIETIPSATDLELLNIAQDNENGQHRLANQDLATAISIDYKISSGSSQHALLAKKNIVTGVTSDLALASSDRTDLQHHLLK